MKRFWLGCGLIALIAGCSATVANQSSAQVMARPITVFAMPQLTPNDFGYRQFPDQLNRIRAKSYWWAITHRSCAVGIDDVDTGTDPVRDIAHFIKRYLSFVPDGSVLDSFHHGTSVVSVLSGTINNHIGVAGLSNCPVYSSKVYMAAKGTWDDDWVAAAVNGSNNLPVRVINVEVQARLGNSFISTIKAIEKAAAEGYLVVIPAGNNGKVGGTGGSALAEALAGIPGVIRVAGVNLGPGSKVTMSGSSFHGSAADIAAPMVVPVVSDDGSVYAASGTSVSSAVVSAIAAEMFNFNPALTNVDVAHLLQSSCTKARDWATKAPLDVSWHCVVDATGALLATGWSPYKIFVQSVGRGRAPSGI